MLTRLAVGSVRQQIPISHQDKIVDARERALVAAEPRQIPEQCKSQMTPVQQSERARRCPPPSSPENDCSLSTKN